MVNMKLSDFVRTSTIHMLILCTRRCLQPFPVTLFRRNGERQTNLTGNCNIAILTSRGTYFFSFMLSSRGFSTLYICEIKTVANHTLVFMEIVILFKMFR